MSDEEGQVVDRLVVVDQQDLLGNHFETAVFRTQAMGVMLTDRNQAQVSMNLLNYEKTPIHRVQELVKIEAARYGARVLSSEIVGLVPQAALVEAA